MRHWCLLVLLTPLVLADEAPLLLEGGAIVVRESHFIRINQFNSYVPELSFTVVNMAKAYWDLRLRFDIEATCGEEKRRWNRVITVSLKQAEKKAITETVIPLVGTIDGCSTTSIKPSLLSAENPDLKIDFTTKERIDYKKRRDEEATKQERLAAAETARQKRLEVERRRRQAETDARSAQEGRKLRVACESVYRATIDKKVRDLTVREEQQVRGCQALHLYPPD